MSVLSAAIQILKKSGSPLHAKNLASQMIAKVFGNQTEKLRRPLSVHDSTRISRITVTSLPLKGSAHRSLRLGILP